MIIRSINIKNIRSFEKLEDINFSDSVNILLGPNNAGKTTILKSLYLLQGNPFNEKDITKNKGVGKIEISYNDNSETSRHYQKIIVIEIEQRKITKYYKPWNNPDGRSVFSERSTIEPHNLIYPYFAKRKVVKFEQTINDKASSEVRGNFTNLYAKIDRLSSGSHPLFKEFDDACKNILGFSISTTAADEGKIACLPIGSFDYISLDLMGEGVVNILGLIVDLCVADKKIFLIEEPENDIHPKALKALLQLVEKKSENNQFFISTHSNIVAKYLGGMETSKIFSITMELKDKIPVSTVEEIDTPGKRQNVLESLGYEFYDYDLWKAWLFLEESSAEKIIREFIIPHYVPSLVNKLKTFSASGAGNIKGKFNDFNRLFVFLHLEPKYKNKAWVLIDKGAKEDEIISSLKSNYLKSGWHEDQFLQFSKHDFEEYYPERFKKEIDEINIIQDWQAKQSAKMKLVEQILDWVNADPSTAKKEFEISATEVINLIKKIGNKILN